MNDFRILNGNKRVTLIESFGGDVTVIERDNGIKQIRYESIEDAVKAIESGGSVVGTSFLHGPHGKHKDGKEHG